MGDVICPTFTRPRGDPSATVPGHRRIAAASPAPRLQGTGGRRGEYGIADIARPLGLLDFKPRAIIEKLRVLARTGGLPLPRTPRIVKGRVLTGPDSIHAHSRWDAGEIDAWLEGHGPTTTPPVAGAMPLPHPARAALIARAERVFGEVA